MPGEKEQAVIDDCKAALSKAKGKEKGPIFIRMGDAYKALKQNNKALPCYREAYDLGENDPEFIMRYAAALADSGKAEEALGILQKAIFGTKDLLMLGKLYTKSATISRLIESYEPGLRMAKKAIQTVGMIPGGGKDVQQVLAEAQMVAGFLHWRTGERGKAMQSFERALELYKVLDDRKGLADIYNYIGIMHHVSGELAEALEYFEMSEKLLDRSRININRGQVKMIQGDFKGAEEQFRIAIKKGHDEGYTASVITGQIDMAQLYIEMENAPKARTWTEMAHKSLKGADRDPHLSTVLEIMARVELMEGNLKAALESIERCLAISKANNAKSDEVWGHYVKGLVLEAMGDLEAARKELTDSLEDARRRDHVRLMGLTNMALASVHRKLGRTREAKAAAEEARKCLEKIGAKYLVKKLDDLGS